ncbi:MAG: TetR/AcrR family transcriptional regulator [Anaerolineae bacterium]|nr:TetR/AcrR family transcriptional regulator [Anaerolineae bacterium]MCB9133419.1 TetR/AcrR family transcriptional regulator [Anaerolineales bacterium]
MTTTRDQIIDTTSDLMESQGYHATGLNQIVAESGAPKGSLYHYFPGGKEEMAAEAIDRTGRQLEERIRANLPPGVAPAEALRDFAHTIAFHIEASGYRAGGPLTAVAMETATNSKRLNRACRDAFERVITAFAERLVTEGTPAERARGLSVFVTAAFEGGIILSRTYHSGDPLRQVGDVLFEFMSTHLLSGV